MITKTAYTLPAALLGASMGMQNASEFSDEDIEKYNKVMKSQGHKKNVHRGHLTGGSMLVGGLGGYAGAGLGNLAAQGISSLALGNKSPALSSALRLGLGMGGGYLGGKFALRGMTTKENDADYKKYVLKKHGAEQQTTLALEKLGTILFYQAAKAAEADDALVATEYLEKVGFFTPTAEKK